MVEAFAVASGKGGTGKTTTTLALGMALAKEYDVTVIDADTGMANLLFHAGLDDVEVTLHDLLVTDTDIAISEAVYERFGMSVIPCGTSLTAFAAANPAQLRAVVSTLATETDIILLDSPAAIGSKSAVLPIILASLSDGLKVQEYAHSYKTETAGVIFNRVRQDESVATIAEQASRYFGGPILAHVPERDVVRAARRQGEPLLAHAPDDIAASAFREAAASLEINDKTANAVANRFKSAVIPEQP